MPINKYMSIAMKAFASNVDVKKNYKLIRLAERAVKRPRIRLYQTRDYYIRNEEHKVPVRIFTPARGRIESLNNIDYPVIIFLHGGGWVTGDLESYERVCLAITRQTGHALIAVDYRLAPEYPFPAALEDCYKTVRAVIRWHKMSGAKHKITLMGDSAGGNLAAAVSLYMRDRGEQMVDRQVLIYPATYNNHTQDSPFASVLENGTDYFLTSRHICDYMDLYCQDNESSRNSPYCAPLLAENFENQPDTLIITAQYDPLRDEGEEYGRKLKEAGNLAVVRRIDGTMHGYFSLSVQFAAVRKSYDIINKFLKDEIESDE